LRGLAAAALLLVVLALPVAARAAPPPTASTSIVGGHAAQAEDWPSIAFLLAAWDEDGDGELDMATGCTGTVVKPSWIITAAHCGYRPDGPPVDAMLSITGAADFNDPIGEEIPADRVVVHPAWNPELLLGDAMLMHLERPSSRPAMPLARLGGQYVTDDTVPNVAGWGTIDEQSEISTEILQEAYIDIVDDDVCATYASDLGTQTCAGRYEVAGVCHGDSGGPLTVLDAGGVPHLWGLTSYRPQHAGMPPCDLRVPAVFSWLPAFADWIEAQTAVQPPPGPVTPSPPPPPPPAAAPPRDRTPPVLSRAKLSTKRFKAARKARAKLTFRLSEAAAIRITVLKGTKALSPSVSIAASAGRTSRTFTGRLGRKALKPGRYRLRIAAVDAAGNPAKPAIVRFRVV
jgi:secreted trypsin-like serine protease